MHTIVLGYTGSETAERALVRAAELAEALTARLVVVSVTSSTRRPVSVPVPDPDPALVPSPAGQGPTGEPMLLPGPEPERFPEPKELARRQLEQARMTLAPRRVDAEYVAEVGRPAERLLEVASDRGADLLVVGSRAHGLLERLLGRPVSRTVARRARCDVLLVR